MAVEYPHILAKNLLEDAAISYDKTEDSIHKPEYLADRSRVSKFQGENASPQHLIFDLGSAKSIDTCVLDKGFIITGGSSLIKVQHYSDDSQYPSGGSWVDDLTLTKAGDLASNLLPLWKAFTAVSRRYWRLRFTGLTAAPIIFNFWLGARVELDFSPYGGFDPWREESVDESIESKTGALHTVHYFRRRLLSLPWENLVDAKMDKITSWWEQAGRDGLNWWFLWQPATYAGSSIEKWAPVYLSSGGMVRYFPFYFSTRSGTIEGREVL